MEKFIMANDCAVRVLDTGSGDNCLLLLHGYLESLDIWYSFTGHFGSNYRIVALDLPGHGISEVKGDVHTMEFLSDVVAGALSNLGIKEAIVVGHSMGGYVAQVVLERHPEMVAGLVLLHSSPFADTPEKSKKREREIDIVLSGKKELLAKIAPAERFAAANRARFADEIADMADQVFLTEDEGIVAILRGMSLRRNHCEMLGASATPQLVVLGKADDYIPMELAEKVVAGLPHAEVLWMENSGHMSFIEEPELLSQRLCEFVDKCYSKLSM